MSRTEGPVPNMSEVELVEQYLSHMQEVQIPSGAKSRIWYKARVWQEAESRRAPFSFRMRLTLRQGATFIFTLALLVGLIQIVFLAGGSLPGERLYTIKRSVEVVWIAATPEDNRGTVRLELLDRRVQEVGALLATGQSVPDPLFVEIEEALTSVTEHPYEWGSPNGHILPYVERSRRTLNALALMYTDEPEVARLAAASGRAWESLWDPIY